MLRAVEQEFKVDIPNFVLADLRTLGDVREFINAPRPNKKGKVFKLSNLPPNLYIEQ